MNAQSIGWLLATGSITSTFSLSILPFMLSRAAKPTGQLSRSLAQNEARHSGSFVLPVGDPSESTAKAKHACLFCLARLGAILTAVSCVLFGLNEWSSAINPVVSLFVANGLAGMSFVWDPCLRSLLS